MNDLGDVLCPDGKAKLLAYQWLYPLAPHVFALDAHATADTVHTALCLDMRVNHTTQPEERSALFVAEAMYGWPFEALSPNHIGIIRC